jgi:cyclopropane-fatty-acyl-phospholipid synthase
MSLADAQVAKLDRICRELALSPDDHVVEIGTGWGSFAVHAASRYGCRVTTTTISGAQYDHARKRVADAGLADRVTVLDADYRDLTGIYDKLVSVEMIEAVDWRDHATFFSTCARLLRPDGLAVLQAIVIADESFERAKHHDDFIRRYIFPGGCLPSNTSIAVAAIQAGFRVAELKDIGCHYAETLRRWHTSLNAQERAVEALGLGTEFRRMWALYLSYCEAAFLERHVSDVQVVLAKPGWQGRPGDASAHAVAHAET